MQFEVPQFIEIEDKIFGPLTWRQFLYLSGGIGAAVVIFLTLPIVLFVIIGLPVAALGGALAFYPVNNRSFDYFLEALFGYLTSTRLYLWRQDKDMVHKTSVPAATTSPQARSLSAAGVERKPRKDISSLARKLELQALQKN